MAFAERHPAYDHINAKENMTKRHGTQAGDPEKGAKAMYEFAVMKDPPLRSVIGTDAWKAIHDKYKSTQDSQDKYDQIANSTDVDDKDK